MFEFTVALFALVILQSLGGGRHPVGPLDPFRRQRRITCRDFSLIGLIQIGGDFVPICGAYDIDAPEPAITATKYMNPRRSLSWGTCEAGGTAPEKMPGRGERLNGEVIHCCATSPRQRGLMAPLEPPLQGRAALKIPAQWLPPLEPAFRDVAVPHTLAIRPAVFTRREECCRCFDSWLLLG